MAVALDTVGTAVQSAGASTSLTYNGITVGAGANALVLLITFASTTSPGSPLTATWDSGGTNQAMTPIGAEVTGDGGRQHVFMLLAPTAGNKTLAIAWHTADQAVACCISLSGVLQTGGAVGAIANETSASETSGTPNLAVTCTDPGTDFGINMLVSAATPSAPAFNSAFSTVLPGTSVHVAGQYATAGQTSATTHFTWTLTGGTNDTQIGFEVLPAATGPIALTASSLATATDFLSGQSGLSQVLTATSIASGAAAIGSAPAFVVIAGLTATSIASGAAAVGPATINQFDVLAATSIASGAAAVGPATFSQLNHLTATSIASGAASIGVATFAQVDIFAATSIASGAAAVAVATFNQVDHLTATSIASGAAIVGQPTIIEVLTATSIASGAASVGVTTLNVAPTANSIASGAASIGVPAFNQVDIFTATAIASGAVGVGSPAFNQFDVLNATSIASGVASVGIPALVQLDHFATVGIASGAASVGVPAFNQNDIFVANAVATSGAGIDQQTLFQVHVLAATSIASGAASIGQPAPSPNITAISLASGAAAIGVAPFSIFQILAATSIATGAAALDQPVFQRNVIGLGTPGIASAAAGIDQPQMFVFAGIVFLSDYLLDHGLNTLNGKCDRIYVCNSRPMTLSDVTTFSNGFKSFVAGNAFASDVSGSPDGTRAISTAFNDGNITVDGNAAWWAAVDNADSQFLASGPLASGVAVFNGEKFALPSFAVHIFNDTMDPDN